MKHTVKITIFLLVLFLAAQFTGLLIINNYIDYEATEETGVFTYKDLPYDIERPETTPSASLFLIFGAILIGTVLLLVLIRFRKVNVWKIWFFLSVLITLSVALSAFISQWFALILAFIFAFIKIFRPNLIVHNITELLIYGGLAAIFAPLLNFYAALVLLLLISVYDMFAVWQSKHMVKLANFQTDSKIFAGFFVPYKMVSMKQLKKKAKGATEEVKNAVLGGGDIGFPLIFAAVLIKDFGLFKTMIVPVFAALALLLLLLKSKKDRFYPAMPFITAGCLAGYGVLQLL
ncbi:MAG: hypothetical protein GY861_26585 [bacterium]|nr:hypothetical protein [bacterium]